MSDNTVLQSLIWFQVLKVYLTIVVSIKAVPVSKLYIVVGVKKEMKVLILWLKKKVRGSSQGQGLTTHFNSRL